MKNELYRGLSQTELKARCDESCKRLLSNKEIIARVLKFTVDEFSELDINYIRDFCIERKQIYHMPKELTGEQDGLSAEMITGRDSESTIVGEGAFRYDVVFETLAPKDNESAEKLLIDLEGQNRYNPGYILETRGVFYGSRLISSQYGREFSGSHYDDIKKVYSIWICMNPETADINTVTSYAFMKRNQIGESVDRKKSYDKIEIVKICLGGNSAQEYDNYTGVVRLLDVVFSNHLTAKAKAQILNEEFGIPMESIEQEVEGMCNISEFYYETGLNDGISQGISQGEINATIQMGHDYGIAKDEIINRIVWKYAMAREEAAERVEKMWGRAQEA